MMTTILTLLVALFLAVGALATKELGPLCSWLAPKVVSRAARRLPAKHRVVREEEWLGHLDSMEGMQLYRLVAALGIWVASLRLVRMPSIRRAAAEEETTPVGRSLRLDISDEQRVDATVVVSANVTASGHITLSGDQGLAHGAVGGITLSGSSTLGPPPIEEPTST